MVTGKTTGYLTQTGQRWAGFKSRLLSLQFEAAMKQVLDGLCID